jgi:hypothetical protein
MFGYSCIHICMSFCLYAYMYRRTHILGTIVLDLCVCKNVCEMELTVMIFYAVYAIIIMWVHDMQLLVNLSSYLCVCEYIYIYVYIYIYIYIYTLT